MLDRPRDPALAGHAPRCERIVIATDLGGDWPTGLAARGFQPNLRTAWLVEGVLQYLEPPMVETLFERLDRASPRGSIAL